MVHEGEHQAGGSQKGARIIGYACQECREHDRYALWWDTVVEAA